MEEAKEKKKKTLYFKAHDPSNGKMTEVALRVEARLMRKGDHLLSTVEGELSANSQPTCRNEVGNTERVNLFFYRYENGNYDQKKFCILSCRTEKTCVSHNIKLHYKIPKGVPLPFGEASKEEFDYFKEKLDKYIDWEESKKTKFGCKLIAKSFYKESDKKFKNGPKVSWWGRDCRIFPTLLSLKLRQKRPRNMSTRHDPEKCNNNRCVAEDHLLGFGTARQQADDKIVAGTRYKNPQKRKRAEELIENEEFTDAEIAKLTGYSGSHIRDIRQELRGNPRKRKARTITPEYQKKRKTEILKHVVKVKNCGTYPQHMLDHEGRPRRTTYGNASKTPYAILYAIEKHKGKLPEHFLGLPTYVMHNEIKGDPNYCEERPNCVNPAHMILGNVEMNNKTAERRQGEEHRCAIFSDAETVKFRQFVKEGIMAKDILLMEEFGTKTYGQVQQKLTYERRKAQLASKTDVFNDAQLLIDPQDYGFLSYI